jgi:hypothetical protein
MRFTSSSTSGPNSGRVQPALGVEGEALHVAVPERPHRRAVVGLSSGTSPSGVMRRILPASESGSCEAGSHLRVTGRDVQHPVGPERDAPAVVGALGGDAVEHDLGLAVVSGSSRTTRLSEAVVR